MNAVGFAQEKVGEASSKIYFSPPVKGFKPQGGAISGEPAPQYYKNLKAH